MDHSPRYSQTRVNPKAPTSIRPGHIGFSQGYGIRELTMYTAAGQKTSVRQQMRADLEENMKNSSFETYPTKQSLSADTIDQQPKQEGLWQGMFKSATNLLGEHLSRGSGTFIKNWSSINSPLSVTVVSPDFYKSLHPDSHEMPTISVDANIYTTSPRCNSKDSHNSEETLASVLYDNKIVSGSCSVKLSNSNCSCCSNSGSGSGNGNSDSSDVDKRWKEYKCMYVDFNAMQKDTKINEESVNTVNTEKMNECVSDESRFDIIINDETEIDKSMDFGSTLSINDEPVMIEKSELELAVQMHETQQEQKQHEQQQHEQQQTKTSPQISAMGTMFTNAYNKVVSGVADLLQLRSTSPDPEPSALFTKRAAKPPKPKPKKVHVISSGRGRGRGRSQLRRSGVSQKRHRKERSRYDRSEDIKYDIENWEEMENGYSDHETIESMDVCDFAGGITSMNKRPMMVSLEDIKPVKRKLKRKDLSCTNLSKFSSSINLNKVGLDEDDHDFEDDDEEDSEEDSEGDSEEDSEEDIEEESGKESQDDSDSDSSGEEMVQFRSSFRNRLSSTSSVESDESFCIIFNDNNTETEAKTDIEAEAELETTAEATDSEDESDFDIEKWQPSKIRFNPTPTVHTIVHWRFAYKAARRGPWEEMARDRARFQRRVMDINSVLEPVFTAKHRERVWNERFADEAEHFSV